MHNRKLILLLAGSAALAAAPLAWTQSTDPTLGSGTTTGTSGTAASGTATGTTGSSTSSDNSSDTTGAQSGTATGTTTGTPMEGSSSAATSGYSSGATTGSTSKASGSATLQGTDAVFLQKALEGGREEVQNAQVAMRSAQRAEVRNAASMMLEDHTRTNQKLEQLASGKGWDVPAASDTAESDQSRLGTGAAFDDNYLEQEIRHHRETISLYRAQAASGSDPELRQFAKDTLPGLEHHLEMLQGSISAK